MAAAGAGRLSRSATRVVAKEANGFHLLRIDGYAETKKILPGQKLSSNPFVVGGHSWRINYYPNGRDASANHGAISVYLQLTNQHAQKHLQARYKFSLLDHGGNAAYELPTENGSFASVGNYPIRAVRAVGTLGVGGGEEEPDPGCGHDEFIKKEDLERREHLIRDDSIVVRRDIGVTEIANSVLAHDELIHGWGHDEEEGYEYGEPGMYPPPPRMYGAPRARHQRRRRADDNEYINWCLDQRHTYGPTPSVAEN